MNDDYNSFLMRLKEERIRCGLTQTQLGKQQGLLQSTFSRSETGHRRFAYHELKSFCASGIDIFYAFTGHRAVGTPDFPLLGVDTLEAALYHLGMIYLCTYAMGLRKHRQACTRPAAGLSSMAAAEASFDRIREQLKYLSYLSGGSGKGMSLLRRARHYHGITQVKMAERLGMDVKTLRHLEKGRRLPDSEVIWNLYLQFQISPVLILNDPYGMWSELRYVSGMLDGRYRELVFHILENGLLLTLD